jgi:hypothetical protein
MAPGFDQLSDHDFQDEEDEIDFSDLKEKFDVRMEEGLDTFVVGRYMARPEIFAKILDRSSMVFLLSTRRKNRLSSNF